GGGGGGFLTETEDRQPLHAGEGKEDAHHRRIAGGSRQGAGAAAARRRACPLMILVVAEQKDGKVNRASWEAIAAAQQLAGAATLPVNVRVPGAKAGDADAELASAQVAGVMTVSNAAIDAY